MFCLLFFFASCREIFQDQARAVSRAWLPCGLGLCFGNIGCFAFHLIDRPPHDLWVSLMSAGFICWLLDEDAGLLGTSLVGNFRSSAEIGT